MQALDFWDEFIGRRKTTDRITSPRADLASVFMNFSSVVDIQARVDAANDTREREADDAAFDAKNSTGQQKPVDDPWAAPTAPSANRSVRWAQPTAPRWPPRDTTASDAWEAELRASAEARPGRGRGGHQPFRNPVNQDAYDGELRAGPRPR